MHSSIIKFAEQAVEQIQYKTSDPHALMVAFGDMFSKLIIEKCIELVNTNASTTSASTAISEFFGMNETS